jgi:hypothetical protein
MILRWLPVVSAVLQLVGTALILWGLQVTTNDAIVTFFGGDRKPLPAAGIVHENPRAFAWGVRLLLAGLALAVVVTLL